MNRVGKDKDTTCLCCDYKCSFSILILHVNILAF
jgi:hypothetical protein